MDLVVINHDFMICINCKREWDDMVTHGWWKFCPCCGIEWKNIRHKEFDYDQRYEDCKGARTGRLYPLQFDVWEWSMENDWGTTPYDWEHEGTYRNPKEAIEKKRHLEQLDTWLIDCRLVEIVVKR